MKIRGDKLNYYRADLNDLVYSKLPSETRHPDIGNREIEEKSSALD
jgi:hypothetical protein